jgi:transcriptional regulator with XRE-family HTH domain
MNSNENYGMIIRLLRRRCGLSIQNAAEKIGRSAGWLCEVENGAGTCRLTSEEFDRIVELLGGSGERYLFKTWVAGLRNQARVSKIYDGAVLKYIRLKRGLSLTTAARLAGLSKGYLSKLETGGAEVKVERRNELMRVYGYSPSSFKNLSTDPARSAVVPDRFKFQILLQTVSMQNAEQIYQEAIQKFQNNR